MDLNYEQEALNRGFQRIAGVDEVGRGCLFGDVVACALVMPKGEIIEGVRDSKKLTPKKRDALYEEILKTALAVGIGRISPQLIDKYNIKEASKLAMMQALDTMRTPKGDLLGADFVYVDAETLPITTPQRPLIHGDDVCYSIACASIIAKVYRDRLCIKWEEEYPGYGIAQHKGYGTRQHRQALLTMGPSTYHRRSFLKKILGEGNV